MQDIKIAIAQLNFTVGDFEGNLSKIIKASEEAATNGAEIVVFGELALTGYCAEDLFKQKEFQEKASLYLQKIVDASHKINIAIIVGSIGILGDKLYNKAYFIYQGAILHKFGKRELPNYGIFDEKRFFDAYPELSLAEFKGFKIGIAICEDIWIGTKTASIVEMGADFIISLNASPFSARKIEKREKVVRDDSLKYKIPFIYVNQVGGNDDIIFDGTSFVMNNGKIFARLKSWQEEIAIISPFNKAVINEILSWEENYYSAAIVGLRDYVEKNNLGDVILGLSGGIDSAISLVMAIDALGAARVRAVMLPSKYTSTLSKEDARKVAELNKIKFDTISIEKAVAEVNNTLAPSFKGLKEDLTEENIQARTRGLLLMALCNKFNLTLLSTGNKSEMATGYATLYGDMCGAYNMIKDIYKTEIFALSKWRNKNKPAIALGEIGEIIPESIINKAPSAELRPDQRDEDSLPPYEILDQILKYMLEEHKSREKIAALGFDPKLIDKIYLLLKRSEYKRRQAVPGPIISEYSLYKDRRYPLTNKFD